MYTTLELETTILSTREELARKEEELIHLKILLTKTAKERDEAIAKSHKLTLENLLIQQKLHHQKLQNQIEDDQFDESSRSDCDENIISNSPKDSSVFPPLPLSSPPQQQPLIPVEEEDLIERILPKKPLPEKGKFLKTVMEAGPLLQTLLLAGPLPQWQHPPPQLSSIEIPPVTISSSPRQPSCLSTTANAATVENCFSKKRAADQLGGSVSAGGDSCSKYQRVVHQSSLTNNNLIN